jgi:three-Cys-motif partner protein
VTRDEDGDLPRVGLWAERKYDHLRAYLTMFSTGMRHQWRTRVYVDLFTGAGKAQVEGTSRVIPTSALIALGVRHRFDHYVFCEASRQRAKALRARVERFAPDASVAYVPGDCNARIADLLAVLPLREARDTIAVCFVDPFALSNLAFETFRRLAERRRIDFLVLVPSAMDANRNAARLLRASEPTLDRFLGGRDWRARWDVEARKTVPRSFGTFVVDEFGRSMQAIGYLQVEPRDAVNVDARGHPLYHLMLFSRNRRGLDFWQKTRLSASKQRPLFEK